MFYCCLIFIFREFVICSNSAYTFTYMLNKTSLRRVFASYFSLESFHHPLEKDQSFLAAHFILSLLFSLLSIYVLIPAICTGSCREKKKRTSLFRECFYHRHAQISKNVVHYFSRCSKKNDREYILHNRRVARARARLEIGCRFARTRAINK